MSGSEMEKPKKLVLPILAGVAGAVALIAVILVQAGVGGPPKPRCAGDDCYLEQLCRTAGLQDDTCDCVAVSREFLSPEDKESLRSYLEAAGLGGSPQGAFSLMKLRASCVPQANVPPPQAVPVPAFEPVPAP